MIVICLYEKNPDHEIKSLLLQKGGSNSREGCCRFLLTRGENCMNTHIQPFGKKGWLQLGRFIVLPKTNI